jgi:hypothetical protein
MLAAVKALASHLPASASRASLPASIAIPASSSAPTHILAISSSSKTSPSPNASLFATHNLVLLSSCALLPSLPQAYSGAAPLVPLALPSVDTFSVLHGFLYTHDQVKFLSSALCLNIPASAAGPSSDAGKRSSQLAGALLQASGGDVSRLMAIAKRINGIWRNACALGVHDTDLWDSMDLAWEAVLGAMNAIARS